MQANEISCTKLLQEKTSQDLSNPFEVKKFDLEKKKKNQKIVLYKLYISKK